ncbi:MAG: hypothetical protein KF690_08285, partial [Bacteroidetes bacterium]|nr:hypothetical protein [Bacteroidota bacterium]
MRYPKKPMPRFLVLFVACLVCSLPAAAQNIEIDADVLARYRTAPLADLETELAALGQTVLRHELFQYKDYANAQFLTLLQAVLSRPESYDYPFRKLETVSRIFPQDN